MNTALKFIGGLALGAAIGAGVYILVTKDSEEGIVADIKTTINRAIEEGKRSAEERRRQLEQELGFSVDDEPPIMNTETAQPVTPAATPEETVAPAA